MIKVNSVDNVNQALAEGLLTLASPRHATDEQSRNGPVRVARGPVVTETLSPLKRVLFSPTRNANPFFHMMEALWMLGGRQDLPWLAYYNKQMAAYSDDGGKTQPAAYGFRWREHFSIDQINFVARTLVADPRSRRAVINMWDVERDPARVDAGGADVPCNTTIYFQLLPSEHGSQLDMAVCCRSNDAVWGAHGANAVHFSVLQEYVAAQLGSMLGNDIRVGTMTQFSNNYHYYTDVVKDKPETFAMDVVASDYYTYENIGVTPWFTRRDVLFFDEELDGFLAWAGPKHRDEKREKVKFEHPFLNNTARRMVHVWDAHKQADYVLASDRAYKIAGEDWQRAAREWVNRKLLQGAK